VRVTIYRGLVVSSKLNVREKFVEFFAPRAVPWEEEDEDFADEQKRLANDARIFTETQAYKDFRHDLQRLLDGSYADPTKGTDVAAATALRQAGLRESMVLLDRVVSRQEVEHGD